MLQQFLLSPHAVKTSINVRQLTRWDVGMSKTTTRRGREGEREWTERCWEGQGRRLVTVQMDEGMEQLISARMVQTNG